MADDLVERVARAMCLNGSGPDWVEQKWPEWVPDARVAIAIVRPAVIEKCAEVADSHTKRWLSAGQATDDDDISDACDTAYIACSQVTRAIRALSKDQADVLEGGSA